MVIVGYINVNDVMLDFEELKLYKKYLNTIQFYLDKYFEDQKEYICCQKGCAYCCQKGMYPYSRLEFDYLMVGFFKIDLKEQQAVIKRIQALKKEYEAFENKDKFMHRCPFLSDENICTVYNYRGLICRTFGLLKPNADEEIIMPFCQSLGLNYSKVYNREKKMLDVELVQKHGYKRTPKAYDLSFKTLMNKDLFQDAKIEFGDIKSLIEWL